MQNQSLEIENNSVFQEDGNYNINLFVENLRNLRKEKGYTQVELGEKLGKTRGAIGHWETGQREPNLTVLTKMAKIFDVSIDFLLGKTDIRKPNFTSHYVLEKIKEAGYVENNGEIKKEDIENFVKDLQTIKQLRGVK